MNEKEFLEKELERFLSNTNSVAERQEILKDAWWQSHNPNYCNAMANIEMGGEISPRTEYWDECCRYKESIGRLIQIYEEEINID
ncbi:MAG: hypothetical protein ACI4MH_01300 [Candidatus Coproplasma sp.]